MTTSLTPPPLFLGFELSDKMANLYRALSDEKRALFVGSDARLLQERGVDNALYLGKPFPPFADHSSLKGAAENILTLLEKLFPEETFSKDSLTLFVTKP